MSEYLEGTSALGHIVKPTCCDCDDFQLLFWVLLQNEPRKHVAPFTHCQTVILVIVVFIQRGILVKKKSMCWCHLVWDTWSTKSASSVYVIDYEISCKMTPVRSLFSWVSINM